MTKLVLFLIYSFYNLTKYCAVVDLEQIIMFVEF